MEQRHHPRFDLIATEDGRILNLKGEERHQRDDGQGYKTTWIKSLRRHVGNHRIVVEAWCGCDLPSNLHVHHRDGDASNNAIANLQICTPADHRRIHAAPKSREPLSAEAKQAIRESDEPAEELAKKHNCTPRAIRYIRRGDWGHGGR